MVDFAPIRWIEAALGRNSQQWRRQVETAIDDIRRDLFRREQNDINANKSQNSTARLTGSNVRSLPVVQGFFKRLDGFGLSPSPVVKQELLVPPGKTKLVLTAIGNVSVLDMTSGGVAVAYAQIAVGSRSSPLVSASKDSGASRVNNVIAPGFGIELRDLTPNTPLEVTLTVTASNPSAFTSQSSNFATLTLTALFFD